MGKREIKFDFAHKLQKDTVVGCTGFDFDCVKGKILILWDTHALWFL